MQNGYRRTLASLQNREHSSHITELLFAKTDGWDHLEPEANINMQLEALVPCFLTVL